MRLIASAPSRKPRMPAGSERGPTMTNSLRVHGRMFAPKPSATRSVVMSPECIVSKSASPARNDSASNSRLPAALSSTLQPVSASKRLTISGHSPVFIIPPMTATRTGRFTWGAVEQQLLSANAAQRAVKLTTCRSLISRDGRLVYAATAGLPSYVRALRVTDATTEVDSGKRLHVAIEESDVGAVAVSRWHGIGHHGRHGRRVTSRPVGEESDGIRSRDFTQAMRRRTNPRRNVNVHRVRKEVRGARWLGFRANENGVVDGLGNRGVGGQGLVAGQFNHRRQRVEPILRSVDEEQRLHALAAARDGVLIFVNIHRKSDTPLVQVAEALGGARLFFRACKARQKQARQHRDDGDDHQQLNQREGPASVRALLHFLRRAHRHMPSTASPSPPRAGVPGSGTATMVSKGRFAAVPKLRELKTPLMLLSAANRRRLRLSPASRSLVNPGVNPATCSRATI